jgi:adenine-specific DNA methylase
MNNYSSYCPRLIEVALPIREISAESVRDKSLRHGHISTLHLWWARPPQVACRAVVYAALVLPTRIEYLEKRVKEKSAQVAGLTQLLQKSTKKCGTLPKKMDPLTAP